MKPTRERLLPYRILAYLLYADQTWLTEVGPGQVRVVTGEAARFFRLKISLLWEALYWLEKNQLVDKITKERKRGAALVSLKGVTRGG